MQLQRVGSERQIRSIESGLQRNHRANERPTLADWINFHGKTETNRHQRRALDGCPQGNLNHLVC
jgi:hypothetical protein